MKRPGDERIESSPSITIPDVNLGCVARFRALACDCLEKSRRADAECRKRPRGVSELLRLEAADALLALA
eukprot:CAMPEP_0179858658 /NCGR_PEP_ID=MMETSP0982-20121206/12558_1 /TAXON_ID=483367 /ORGANISM="non described non described, Strain CCMP 2436" /LENGTH=69 /DNA_ID=CAMNT_0021745573 /DNA_START=49 /DNA_END=254 /DNA_ORIENTATION=+